MPADTTDSDKFRRPFSAQRHPDSQATSQLHNAPLKNSTIAGAVVLPARRSERCWYLPAAGYRRPSIEHGNKDGTNQVTQPGLRQVAHICPWLIVPAFTPKVRNMCVR